MIDWKEFDNLPLGTRFEASIESIGLGPIFKKVLETGSGTITRFYKEGYSDTALDFLLNKISELKGRKVYESNISGTQNMYYWDDAFLDLTYTKNKYITINLASCNDAVSEACKETASMFSVNPKRGYVFAITRGSGGNLSITRIGYAGTTFERGNYTEEICKDYDYIVEDLKSKDPTGRIVILDGVPGCGKCISSGTIMMDPESGILTTIDDVVSRKLNTLSFDNDAGIIAKTPSAWLNTGKKTCLSVNLDSGHYITGTPEHPVMTVDGWKKLTDLSMNDYIAIASKIPFPTKTVSMPDEEVYILAGLLAEGNYTQNFVQFTNDDHDITEIMNNSLSLVDGYLKQYSCHESYEYRVISPLVSVPKYRKSKIRLLLDKA